ncbi:MAG: YbjN domain-containing protein [Sphingomonadales bacterium]|nr:YbjN domain-containing protein [Sphingomonadales bacterium]
MDDELYDEDEAGAAPIDMLAAFFAAHGWTHEHVGEDEIVATTQGSWANYELRAIWRDEDQVLQLLAFPDVRVVEAKRAPVWEVIGLINEQLWLGHFEMWSSSGMILFRHGILLGPDATLTLAQAQTVVETAIDECERFYPVFQFVLWGGKTPAEALSASLIDTRGEA